MNKPKLVLDTTYLLPFFGIEVQGIDEERITSLRRKYTLIYSALMLPELWAKVLREVERREFKKVPDQALEALQALLGGTDVRLASPTSDQLTLAAKLRLAGHKDLFDCLGYGCAVSDGGIFLSEDKGLREFLEKLGNREFDPKIVVPLAELDNRL